jgi:hypothetical protein
MRAALSDVSRFDCDTARAFFRTDLHLFLIPAVGGFDTRQPRSAELPYESQAELWPGVSSPTLRSTDTLIALSCDLPDALPYLIVKDALSGEAVHIALVPAGVHVAQSLARITGRGERLWVQPPSTTQPLRFYKMARVCIVLLVPGPIEVAADGHLPRANIGVHTEAVLRRS